MAEKPDFMVEEEDAFLEAVAWVEVSSHPKFAETYGRKIKELLADANRTALDWRRESKERDVAAGRFEALAELDVLPEYFAGVVEVYRQANAEEMRRRQEAEREEPATHPPKGEAWYEKND